ncbi:MAG: leucine-rich repeat domain-containing protein [Bacteroidales bacterium]|nr:leucine-rich repeat domain-containing protein [Bacteroidales bacterium]
MKKLNLLLLCGMLCTASLNAQTWNIGLPTSGTTPTSAVTATLSGGTLTISGTGAMRNYAWNSYTQSYNTPWWSVRTSIVTVVINQGVTTIGDQAFSSCTGLTSVTIGNGVTSIGVGAFYYCIGLTSVNIPNSVTRIGENAFRNCTGLTSVNIPNSVTSMGWSVFEGCTGLTSVTIPNSVTSIGTRAFSSCTGLTSVTIPNSVTEIGSYAFWGCTGLTSVTIGNGVTSIGVGAFYGCTGLTLVNIPNSVTTIEAGAFSSCTGLKKLVIEDSESTLILSGTGTSYAFNNVSIDTLYLGRNISNNNQRLFGTALKNLTIGNSVTTIGDRAFYDCTSLTSVNIPNSVTEIGSYAFWGCTGLTSVTIGNGVAEIGYAAFAYCTDLTSITIPNSVTTIGDFAFYDCTELTSVTSLRSSPPSLGNNVFLNVNATCCLYVPTNSIELYRNANQWSSFTCINAIPSNIRPDLGIGTMPLQVYPNPVDYELWIMNYEWRLGDVIELFDMTGKRVYYGNRIPVTGDRSPYIIDMSAFQTGNYILRIGNRVAKVVKQF